MVPGVGSAEGGSVCIQIDFPFFPYFFWTLLCWSIVGLLLYCLASRQSKARAMLYMYGVLALAGLSVLGLSVGLMVGNSRSPAVHAAISSVLTFLGAFTVYVMGTRRRFARVLSALVLIVFPVFVTYGTYVGSRSRVDFEEYERREALRNSQILEEYKTDLSIYRYEQQRRIDALYGRPTGIHSVEPDAASDDGEASSSSDTDENSEINILDPTG